MEEASGQALQESRVEVCGRQVGLVTGLASVLVMFLFAAIIVYRVDSAPYVLRPFGKVTEERCCWTFRIFR